MSSFTQRFTIRELVLPFLSGPALLAMSQVHCNFRAHLESFIVSTHHIINEEMPWTIRVVTCNEVYSRELCELMRSRIIITGQRDRWSLMYRIAIEIHDTKIACELCKLAREWISFENLYLNWDGIITEAAFSGNLQRCKNIHSLSLAAGHEPHLDGIFLGAAVSGSCEIFEFARSLALTSPTLGSNYLFDWNGILACGAANGHRDICLLVRKWSREENAPPNRVLDLGRMLREAAGSHKRDKARELCDLAISWSLIDHQSLNWSLMLEWATYAGNRELCEMALFRSLEARRNGERAEFCKMDWNQMLCNATHTNNRELCELARKWAHESDAEGVQALDYNQMLRIAAYNGFRELCELAREWGLSAIHDTTKPDVQAMNWDEMLENAVWGNQPAIYRLAVSWGASNIFNESSFIGMRIYLQRVLSWGGILKESSP